MSYERLAYVYDVLMADVPYHQWLEFLQHEKQHYRLEGNKVLDLACGTGELSVLLANHGFDVTGVDLSEDMLMVASEKAQQLGVNLTLFEQNMVYLEGLGQFDVVTIFCDSLNYLASPEEIQQTFQNVFTHLHEDGLFLFDVHSPYKMEHIFVNETFTLADEDVSYIWDCFPGEYPLSVEHELTFFVYDENSSKYDRFEELHKQRTYEIDQYKQWLKQAGFAILSISADFSNEHPKDASERIFFTCRKAEVE